jgi:hypothetical protein
LDTETAAAEPDPPTPVVSGSFAIYEGARGEIVLVTEIPGRGVERKVFPKALVKMAMRLVPKPPGRNEAEE